MAVKRYNPSLLNNSTSPLPKWWRDISSGSFITITDGKYLNFTAIIDLEGSVSSAIAALKDYPPEARLGFEHDYDGGLACVEIRGLREITEADKEGIKKVRALDKKRLADARQEKADTKKEQISAATELLRKEGLIT